MTSMKPKNTLKDKMYHAIFTSIIKGEYQPETIITEKILVEKYSMSKSPIREALIELCNEGVLRSIPRYGYEVIRITEYDIQEIQNYRIILECGSLNTYWHLINPTTISKLLDIKTCQLEYDVLEHWKRNTDFHLELVACYGNRFLYKSLLDALRFQARAYAQFYWNHWQRTSFVSKQQKHKNLLEAIQSGDKKLAIHYLEADINEFAQGEEFFQPIFL